MTNQRTNAATNAFVRILGRYLGEESIKPASYMVLQPDFEKTAREFVASKDESPSYPEEDAWYVAASRSDGLTPKLAKAVESKIFFTEKDAREFAENVSRELQTSHSHFKITVQIGK